MMRGSLYWIGYLQPHNLLQGRDCNQWKCLMKLQFLETCKLSLRGVDLKMKPVALRNHTAMDMLLEFHILSRQFSQSIICQVEQLPPSKRCYITNKRFMLGFCAARSSELPWWLTALLVRSAELIDMTIGREMIVAYQYSTLSPRNLLFFSLVSTSLLTPSPP